jgi:hypothetical protein
VDPSGCPSGEVIEFPLHAGGTLVEPSQAICVERRLPSDPCLLAMIECDVRSP